MQRLEVSGAVRPLYGSLGFKGLIIVSPMKILQRNLNSSTFVVWEMKRNVSAVRFKFRCNILISGKIIKEMPDSVASGTHCITVTCKWRHVGFYKPIHPKWLPAVLTEEILQKHTLPIIILTFMQLTVANVLLILENNYIKNTELAARNVF